MARPRRRAARRATATAPAPAPADPAARLTVSGVVSGQIVIGHHNVIVNGARGSSVAPQSTGPPPVRRRATIPRPRVRDRLPPLGRDGELAAVAAAVGAGRSVQVVGGPGNGRTALLDEVVRRHTGDVIRLSGAGVDVEDLLQDIFEAGYDTEGYRPDPETLRALVGGVPALVVVDDFDGGDEHLHELLTAAAGAELVVAARPRHQTRELEVVELGGLDLAATKMLVARHLDRSLAPEEDGAAERLWERTGGHPGAVVQAAIAARAAAPGGPVTSFEPGDQLAAAVAASLTDDARALLRTLSALGGLAAGAEVLAAASGGGAGAGPASLDRLAEAGLAVREPAGWRTTGDWADQVVGRCGGPAAPADLAAPLASWSATASIAPIGRNAPVLLRVAEAAAAAGDHARAAALARATAPALALSLRLGAWRRMLALGTASARAAGVPQEAYFLHEDGVRLAALGRRTAAGAALGAAAAVALRHGDAALAALSDAVQRAAGGATTGSSGAAKAGAASRSPFHLVIAHPVVVVVVSAGIVGLGTGIALDQASSGPPASAAANEPTVTTTRSAPGPSPTVPPAAPPVVETTGTTGTTAGPPVTAPQTTPPTSPQLTGTTGVPDDTTGTTVWESTFGELVGRWVAANGFVIVVPTVDGLGPLDAVPVEITLPDGQVCPAQVEWYSETQVRPGTNEYYLYANCSLLAGPARFEVTDGSSMDFNVDDCTLTSDVSMSLCTHYTKQ